MSINNNSILLKGVDTLGNAGFLDTALEGESVSGTVPSGAIGTIEIWEGEERIENLTQIEHAASADFKVFSLGRKVEKTTSSSYSSFGVTVALKTVICKGNIQYQNASVNQNIFDDYFASQPVSDTTVKRFIQAFGDSFVSSYTLGGCYYATFDFETQTQEQQSNVKKSINASGIIEGVKAGASFSKDLQNVAESTNTTFQSSYVVQGSDNKPKSLSPKDLLAFVDEFEPNDNSYIDLTYSSYSKINGLQEIFQSYSELYNTITEKTIYQHLWQAHASFTNIDNIYKFYNIDKESEFYDNFKASKNQSQEDVGTFNTFLSKVTNADIPISKNQEEANELSFNSIAKGLPELALDYETFTAGAGNNSDEFNDRYDFNQGPRQNPFQKPTHITIDYNEEGVLKVISFIETQYTSSEQPTSESTKTNGLKKSANPQNIDLGEDDFITKITLFSGDDLNAISITSFKEHKLVCGHENGDKQDIIFQNSEKEVCRFTYFKGKVTTDGIISQLTCITLKFSPITHKDFMSNKATHKHKELAFA